MGFKDLYLYNFRNFKNLKINLNFPEVFFVGKNGQGKTNILESLYYLCYGSSFRTKNDKIVLKNGETQMAASSTFSKDEENLNKITVQFDNGSKKIILNNSFISDRRDIIKNMPCIVFCHGDLEFVVGSPDKKRLFFDQTLSLIDNEFVDLLRNYKNILKNRNKLLKTSSDSKLISIYSSKLVDYGLQIQIKREVLIKDFNFVLSELFNRISDLKGKLTIEYNSSWKSDKTDEVLNHLESKIDYEKKMKTSCYGPHRDNFKFIYEGEDFANIASTGQLRLASLILRAAQGLFYTKKRNRRPILLLDDVLLELDKEKRDKFMSNLPVYEQAFYTFLPDSSALKSSNAKIYYVFEGAVSNEKNW